MGEARDETAAAQVEELPGADDDAARAVSNIALGGIPVISRRHHAAAAPPRAAGGVGVRRYPHSRGSAEGRGEPEAARGPLTALP